MGTVVGALAECGYGLSWRVCDASGFGVPQRRRRIFFVGYFGDGGGSVPRKYFLSQKACAGILRRAAKRGRNLPAKLQDALELVAAVDVT